MKVKHTAFIQLYWDSIHNLLTLAYNHEGEDQQKIQTAISGNFFLQIRLDPDKASYFLIIAQFDGPIHLNYRI